MKVNARHVTGGIILLVAVGIAWLATRSVGNVQRIKYTETVRGPLQKQVTASEELQMSRTFTHAHYPMHYPGQVAAGISQIVAKGFAPLWQPPDPQVAALPAEQSP